MSSTTSSSHVMIGANRRPHAPGSFLVPRKRFSVFQEKKAIIAAANKTLERLRRPQLISTYPAGAGR